MMMAQIVTAKKIAKQMGKQMDDDDIAEDDSDASTSSDDSDAK